MSAKHGQVKQVSMFASEDECFSKSIDNAS